MSLIFTSLVSCANIEQTQDVGKRYSGSLRIREDTSISRGSNTRIHVSCSPSTSGYQAPRIVYGELGQRWGRRFPSAHSSTARSLIFQRHNEWLSGIVIVEPSAALTSTPPLFHDKSGRMFVRLPHKSLDFPRRAIEKNFGNKGQRINERIRLRRPVLWSVGRYVSRNAIRASSNLPNQ